MNRIKTTYRLFHKLNVAGLAAISLLVTWMLVYLRMLEYLKEQGTRIEAIGHFNILWSTLDLTTLFFSFLVFVAAGLLPVIAVLIKPTPTISKYSQSIWVVLIIGLLYVAKATS